MDAKLTSAEMEYEPTHIKSTPDERDCPISQEYLKKHGVSLAQLDTWQINVVSEAEGDEKFPKLNWTEIAEVAAHVAFHWNTANGCLRVYENYYEAVKNACKVVMSKRKTETLVVKALEETSHKIIDGAHLFTGYEAPDPDDQYRGPNGAA